MRKIILIISSFLTWAAYDTNLFRRRRDSLASTAIEISLEEEARESLQQRKVYRRDLDIIPRKYRDQKRPPLQRCNYFSTRPRDVRFSNQRKIRRMFNNL